MKRTLLVLAFFVAYIALDIIIKKSLSCIESIFSNLVIHHPNKYYCNQDQEFLYYWRFLKFKIADSAL